MIVFILLSFNFTGVISTASLFTSVSLFFLFLLTSCNNNVVPKGFISEKTYSDATIEQIGHTIQYTIFKYENTPNLSKNRFLETFFVFKVLFTFVRF